MNVDARICGIGRDIVGVALSRLAPAAPGGGSRPVAQSLSSQAWAQATANRLANPNSGGINPAAAARMTTAPVTPPPMAATPPAYNPSNPYNVPGLPGYNPYQPTNPASGYNAANPMNMPGLPGYNPYAPSTQQPYTAPMSYSGDYGGYGGPTAADFGLPSSYDPTGGSGMSPDLSYAFNDPTDMNAINSYFDPTSQIGPWSGY